MSLKPTTYSEAKERANRQATRRRAKPALLPPSERYSGLSSKSKLGKPQSPKNRNSGLSSGKSRKRFGAGRKTREWDAERARLKKRFETAGITTCELRRVGCACHNFLGFAHAKKRRMLTKGDLGVVVLACNYCHDQIEVLPHAEMERIIMAIISARSIQP